MLWTWYILHKDKPVKSLIFSSNIPSLLFYVFLLHKLIPLSSVSKSDCQSRQRSELLEALEKVQASSEELSLLTQLQSTQTLGRKKYLSEDFTLITKQEVEEEGGRVVSVIKGRKRKKALDDNGEREKKHRDPTVVRLGVRELIGLPFVTKDREMVSGVPAFGVAFMGLYFETLVNSS